MPLNVILTSYEIPHEISCLYAQMVVKRILGFTKCRHIPNLIIAKFILTGYPLMFVFYSSHGLSNSTFWERMIETVRQTGIEFSVGFFIFPSF